MSNRISLSILFSLIAVLMAFYSGLVYSQSTVATPLAPLATAKTTHRSTTSMLVSANVQASCRFQIASGAQGASLATSIAAALAGVGSRCSFSQPIVLSFNQALTSLAQIVVSPSSGLHTTQAHGTPFWAEATDQGLLVSF
jgi:hypothetical protein